MVSTLSQSEARDISSIGRRARRLLRDGARLKMPVTLMTVAVVLFSIFVAGGGIYDILVKPPAILGSGDAWTAVDPRSDQQTLSESVVSMFLTGTTFLGLLVSHRSAQVAYDRKKANIMLLMGISLIVLGLAGSYYLILLKLG